MNDETTILPPADEGLSAELAAAAPRRWWNRATIGLGLAVLLMGGFLGGVQAQRQWGPAEPAAGGLPAGGFPRRTPEAAAATTGKVKLVNGRTLYLETGDGSTITVRTGAGTAVTTATKGELSDLKAGDSVTVEGAAAGDGSVTATSVTKK